MSLGKCELSDPKINELIDWQLKYAWMLDNERPTATIEHFILRWTIENLSLALGDKHESISSPPFRLGLSETEWCINVYPNIFINERNLPSFNLQRLEDKGPAKVGITYKFGVVNACDKTIWFEERKRTNFEKGNIDGHHVPTCEHIQSFPDGVIVINDTLKVVCEIYISYDVHKYIDDNMLVADYDHFNLSSDLIKLMRSKQCSDYCIKIPHFNIVAHKAILSARSPVFKEIINDEKHKTSYELQGISYFNITNLLLFMYSGNFNLVSRNGPPDIGFYECAIKFSVPDLVTLLTPNYINMRSKLNTEVIVFTWRIEDVRTRLTGAINCIRSSPFKSSCYNSPDWILTVYVKRITPDLFNLDIYIDSTEEISALHSVLEISLLDKEEMFHISKTTTRLYKPNSEFGFPEFLEHVPLDDNNDNGFFIGDTLRIHCQWSFVVCHDIFEDAILTLRSNLTELISYQHLSDDLKKLFTSGELSDVTVKANSLSIKAHRSILFARSKTLASKIMYSGVPNGILEISDVDPAVVSLMVGHAYSVTLGELSYDNLLKLQQASEKYGFLSLSLICVQLIGSEININNFFELMRMGSRINNVQLIEKCLKFAKSNVGTILTETEWKEWRVQERNTYELLAKWIPEFEL